jgi:hypothetical protein
VSDLFFSVEQNQQPSLLTTLQAVSDLKLASDVPDDCDVYVFYVPGMTSYDNLKKALVDYGNASGKNVFVGLWTLDAQPYREILEFFKIGRSPAVIVSGPPKWSTDEQKPTQTAFAKIDDPNLLNNLGKATDCINKTCNLFMQGNVKVALSSARNDGYKASLSFYLEKLYGGIIQFLKQVPITWNYASGTVTLGSTSGTGKQSSSGQQSPGTKK